MTETNAGVIKPLRSSMIQTQSSSNDNVSYLKNRGFFVGIGVGLLFAWTLGLALKSYPKFKNGGKKRDNKYLEEQKSHLYRHTSSSTRRLLLISHTLPYFNFQFLQPYKEILINL
ncbi:hypothetical protein RFI_21699 [Reticulomyxa filosa]|uniref:Transmembrane protein n=1 Tax=Reticulomyxa filosa TaxID=46433 RepID=X6MPR0_RETFI|nr:hypothetical protein RFI_21699 [Reticulomyxa filosa]|eukprot:ETO15666.1 hypothetical protein RFI_21699 [Reticulomyxa filosa]